MSRQARLARNVAIGFAGMVATLAIAGLLVVRTGWFLNYVRDTIIADLEQSTGGRVEVGSFSFDERHLRATIGNFVIHGTEPPGAPPFVSIPRIEVDLRLFTSLRRLYDISFIGVYQPAVNVALQADGRSNIPTPRAKSTSNQSALETVVDLAVNKFDLENGVLTLFSVRQPLSLRGNNVHALLNYNLAADAYDGAFSIEPLYLLNGRNTPVNFTVTLPVTLTKDRIDLRHATITTPLSRISFDGSIANLNSPRISALVQGRIAGADLANAGNIPMAGSRRGALPDLVLDANATADNRTIQVAALHAAFGQSNLEASGTLKDPQGAGGLQLRADVSLGELGQLARMSSRPEGAISINAIARLDTSNRFDAMGNIEARNVSFTDGKERLSHIDAVSSFQANPADIELNGLRIDAFGGGFAGNASLSDFARYKVDGRLRGLDIQSVLRSLGERLPYDGQISGSLEAQGDTRTAGTKSITANAHLAIAPGRRGIPVTGRLNAIYNGAVDDVLVENSYVALPHTRANLSGSLSKRMNVAVVSKDLHDLMLPVALTNKGQADFNGSVTGAVSKPRVSGQLAIRRFAIEGRQFDSLEADVAASASAVAVSNAVLNRGAMRARADASLGLRNWSPTPRSPLRVNAAIADADLADVVALAGEPDAGYSGALSATAQVTGTYGDPIGAATIQAMNGTLAGEPFNRTQVQADLTDQLATIPVAYIDTPAGRVDLSAEFRHPRDSFATGQLHAHVRSGTLDLARMPLVDKRAGSTSGTVTMDADVNGALQQTTPTFLLSGVNGNLSVHALDRRGVDYGDLNATAHTTGRNVSWNVTSDFAGSNVQGTGTTALVRDYPTDADLRLAMLPIERVLAAADRPDIPAKGTLSGSAHFQGTAAAPQGNAQLDLSKAVLYGEKIDRADMRVNYLPQRIDVSRLEIASGPSRIDASGRFDHPVDNFRTGQAQFTLMGDHLDLGRSATVQRYRAGLGGQVDINASGSANVRNSIPEVLLTSLNAKISATGIAAEGKQLGNIRLAANTEPGQRLTFALDSNLAGSTIHGSGNATLNSQYPVDARLSIRNANWTRIAGLIDGASPGAPPFEATADADATIRGPLLDAKQLEGALDITKLEVTTTPQSRALKPITIANQGPIQVALNQGVIRIQNARLTGPKTDIQANGSGSITGVNLNLSLLANADLGVMQNFDRDIYSAGSVALAATVRGDLSRPLLNGQLTLHNATFNTASLPLGISNANGTIALNGRNAQIRTLTAESGGGKVSLSGFASFVDTPRFTLQADASNVRVRVQQGVTVSADANVRLAGTAGGSRVTGAATVNRISYDAHTDFGSILTRSAPAVQSPGSPSTLLSNMKLEVRVRSLPGLTIESSLSEDVQADVDLRIRGSADEPGMQGRIVVNSGKLLFFGTDYTVDSGTISFYNPVRIEPILNVSLETQAQGVNVTVRVTGPIENMKLSYTSDPPLQFQEIIALLAAGTTPTSDPTLLANQPPQPAQGYQQMGESAILGQAVANPVGNQLQRVFGITQLKIDPSFTTGSEVPTARLAVQQRITNNLTFTYVQAVDQPNSTIIRMEWAFSPMWSAVATRDQYGIFSLNFFYKREFR